MEDVKLLTLTELSEKLNAYYEFVRLFGESYFTRDGLIHFNHLKGECCKRVQSGEVVVTSNGLEQK